MEDLKVKFNLGIAGQEEKFNKFYDEFFQFKILKHLKTVKKNNYKCSYDCISSEKIDESCLKVCDEPHQRFFAKIESLLLSKINYFQNCSENCRKSKSPNSCIENCTEKTLEMLNKIDVNSEFSKVI